MLDTNLSWRRVFLNASKYDIVFTNNIYGGFIYISTGYGKVFDTKPPYLGFL